jgi:hypothetical protein
MRHVTERGDDGGMDRRGFLKTAGAGLTAAGAVAVSPDRVAAQALSEKHRLDRVATNSYAHTHCHAQFWDRWTTNDVQRSVRIVLAAGYKGMFALEYEDGPWDAVEGSRYLFKEVTTALSTPAPVI